jgi:hemerythrin-like domain-containing protein
MKSITLLLEDHRQIARAVDILEEMATGAKHGLELHDNDVTALMQFMVCFGDRIHQGREEGVLFPALMANPGQGNYSKLTSLGFDHQRQRYLIQGIQESAGREDKKDFVFCATRLVEIVREHLKEEETILFPLAATLLSPDDDERVASDMEAYDKHYENEKLPGLLCSLGDLEAKYLGKAHAELNLRRHQAS